MATTAIPDYPRGITFEQVWAALNKNDEKFEKAKEESRREWREIRESQEESRREWKEIRELQKETARQMKETDRKIGELGNRFGELAEHLVAPGIAKRFNELGFHFEDISPGGRELLDEQGNTVAEIDLLLENGNCIMVVEVKTRPVKKDIAHHIKRLEIVRKHRNKRRDERKIRGAIAGAVFSQQVKQAAIEAGLYVLEQSGDTMQIDIPSGFVPREW